MVHGHRQLRPGHGHPVRGRRRWGGVGEIGGGQHEAEPVPGGKPVVHGGELDSDHAPSGRPGDPQRRDKLERQRHVASLVDIVDLGEKRDIGGAADPNTDRGRAGYLERRGQRGRVESRPLAGHVEGEAARRRPRRRSRASQSQARQDGHRRRGPAGRIDDGLRRAGELNRSPPGTVQARVPSRGGDAQKARCHSTGRIRAPG